MVLPFIFINGMMSCDHHIIPFYKKTKTPLSPSSILFDCSPPPPTSLLSPSPPHPLLLVVLLPPLSLSSSMVAPSTSIHSSSATPPSLSSPSFSCTSPPPNPTHEPSPFTTAPSTSIASCQQSILSPPLPPHLLLLLVILLLQALPFHGGSLHLHPFLTTNPSFPLPPSSSLPSPLPPPILSFSSNPTHKVFNTTLTLHNNLLDPTLPLHGSSLHLRPYLTSDPSFPLLPFVLTPFSSLSFSSKPTHEPFPSTVAPSTSTRSLLATPPPLLPHLFSSSFNPIHEAFNANLRDPTLPLHGSSLHLEPFLTGDP